MASCFPRLLSFLFFLPRLVLQDAPDHKSFEELKELAQDRKLWRALVAAVEPEDTLEHVHIGTDIDLSFCRHNHFIKVRYNTMNNSARAVHVGINSAVLKD